MPSALRVKPGGIDPMPFLSSNVKCSVVPSAPAGANSAATDTRSSIRSDLARWLFMEIPLEFVGQCNTIRRAVRIAMQLAGSTAASHQGTP